MSRSNMQGLDDIAGAVRTFVDIYGQRQQMKAQAARQNWQDEMTLRKYLDEEARYAKSEERQARLDTQQLQQQQRDNYMRGFIPPDQLDAILPPGYRDQTISRLGPNGTVEQVKRYQQLPTGEYYDEAKDAGSKSYSAELYKQNEETSDIGKAADAVAGFVAKRPASEQRGYQGMADAVRGMPNVASATEFGQSVLTAPLRVEQARAGAMFNPANTITPMNQQQIDDKTLDDIAAEAKGDPNIAEQIAREQKLDPAMIRRARGRATNWRLKNTENIMFDSMRTAGSKRTTTPTGGGK